MLRADRPRDDPDDLIWSESADPTLGSTAISSVPIAAWLAHSLELMIQLGLSVDEPISIDSERRTPSVGIVLGTAT